MILPCIRFKVSASSGAMAVHNERAADLFAVDDQVAVPVFGIPIWQSAWRSSILALAHTQSS